MQARVPIDVDPDTGVWMTDGLPMLYVPRHFFVNNHAAIEQALGREAYARQLYEAGHTSAYVWCDAEAMTHGKQGLDVFSHYLDRLSSRGWGLFDFIEVDPERAHARIRLRYSSMVLGQPEAKGLLCYMFAGWFAGAMDWVNREKRPVLKAVCEESACQAQGHAHCTFTVTLQK